ncbi:Probable E3 ubiquitin-protein ligase HERC1 [Geodia barretti]|uniref:Probable E3 ubiquitin-protein ligase HERC1 n=1 Tax=Geodia barretti TaxID=519541 RepID=A0AA35XBW6_GEOBA|nr:Probable E3 ubiquitin-protein ligase HERC1 [Geodia barretti]
MGNNIPSSVLDSHHSDGITIMNKQTFRVNTGRKNQVLLINMTLRALFFTIAIKITSEFIADNPFIGVLTSKKSLTDICIPNDPSLVMWSLNEQQIYWRGKPHHKVPIICSSGCDIRITWSKKTLNIELYVKSESGKIQTDNVPMGELGSEQLWPVFGATTVGKNTPVQFEILESITQQVELHDMTDAVRFVNAGGKISVSEDGRQVYRSNKDSGNSVALINRVLAHGKHTWKLAVISDFGASIGMGLATYNFDLSDKYRNDPLTHVYRHQGLYIWRSYRGHLYSNGTQLSHSLEPLGWQSGATVTVELTLDMREGTLEIAKNGRYLGVAFRDIRGPVQPAIALYAGYEKEIHLIEFHSSDDSIEDVVESDRALVKKTEGRDSVTFDAISKMGKLVLSEDGLTLTREREHSGNAYCLLDITLSSGFHRWSFVIQNDQGASTCLGVAREPITHNNKSCNLYLCRDLYVLRSFQGILYAEGKEVRKGLSEFWLSGSLVEVSFELQPRGGVVRFSVNGEDQGIAFSGLTPPLRPIVGFYAGMEKKVTLVHYEHIHLDPPNSSSRQEQNKVHTDNTHHSSKQHPMPLALGPSKISMYYSTCMVCGSPVDVVALPCKHSYMCAEHLQLGRNCLICDEPVTGVWNILLM